MPSLLIPLLFFVSLSNVSCDSCGKNSLDRMNHCNVFLADMQSASKKLKGDPVASMIVPVLRNCEKALVRTENEAVL